MYITYLILLLIKRNIEKYLFFKRPYIKIRKKRFLQYININKIKIFKDAFHLHNFS